ncbi:MAG: ABC transporter ATP-binding protein [Kiloniellales bacterium]|nr:ABC transporter ATP-binding protein [Kiloniellales bacterium]
MSTIELKGLTKRFDQLTAVREIDLQVGAGEVVCLLGPSGCGKTTTLRMIAGLESVTSGEVLIAGRRVNDLSPRDRDVAMVFQFYALYPTLTVAENLAYPLHAEKLSTEEIQSRVDDTLRLLHLDSVAQRIPGRLSEGEKQRVAVGRAIVRDPQCFLFDEPLSRLDVQLRETMRGEIKEVLTGLSKATVIVTHDQLEALTMADRIAVMRDGVIEQFDTPHRVFAEPSNVFVAGFIGTPQMNLLPATVTAQNGATRCHIAGQDLTLDLPLAGEQAVTGIQYTLGLRPRGLGLLSEPAADSLSADVELIEPMGAETLLHLSTEGQDVRVVLDRSQAPRLGERVHVRCSASKLHLFDASGRRVPQ